MGCIQSAPRQFAATEAPVVLSGEHDGAKPGRCCEEAKFSQVIHHAGRPAAPARPGSLPSGTSGCSLCFAPAQADSVSDGDERSSQLMVVLNEVLHPDDEDARWDALAAYNILDTVGGRPAAARAPPGARCAARFPRPPAPSLAAPLWSAATSGRADGGGRGGGRGGNGFGATLNLDGRAAPL
jgi:hypothetical protein